MKAPVEVLHFAQDSRLTQRFCAECLTKVFQVARDHAVFGTLQLVHSARAVVEERAEELETQTVLVHPGGNVGMFDTPEELVWTRNNGRHCAVVLIVASGR